jgi:folate-binding protein YgfZ
MIIPGMDATAAPGGIARLDHLGVIRASGPDAAAFLQGQLTNDVLGIGDAARLAGWCSAKGRLLASFVVWREAATGDLLLVCSRDLLPPTLKRLAMFVLRAKCKLVDATADLPLHGAVGADALALVGDAAPWSRVDADGRTAIRLPDADGRVRALVAGPAPAGEPLPLDAWRRLEVESGIVAVEAATVDRFVPQMLNHEVVGAVDFRKGCFPGQEVVARSQYRGTTKRRTFLYGLEGPATAGQDVHDAARPEEPAGTVAMAAPGVALVELRLVARGGDLRLGTPDGPRLVERALPYALPLEPG